MEILPQGFGVQAFEKVSPARPLARCPTLPMSENDLLPAEYFVEGGFVRLTKEDRSGNETKHPVKLR